MEKIIIIFGIIIVILIGVIVFGGCLYFNSNRDLESTIADLRGAKITVQRMQDGISRLAQIPRINRRAYSAIRAELKELRNYRDKRERADRELGRVNERGREDLKRCIGLFDDYGRGFDKFYREFTRLKEKYNN